MHRIHAGHKKYTANSLVRRGRPEPFWPDRYRLSGGAGRLTERTAAAGVPLRILCIAEIYDKWLVLHKSLSSYQNGS